MRTICREQKGRNSLGPEFLTEAEFNRLQMAHDNAMLEEPRSRILDAIEYTRKDHTAHNRRTSKSAESKQFHHFGRQGELSHGTGGWTRVKSGLAPLIDENISNAHVEELLPPRPIVHPDATVTRARRWKTPSERAAIQRPVKLGELAPLTDDVLDAGNPDRVCGARPEKLDQAVRRDLQHLILPPPGQDLLCPNFVVHVKGPAGKMEVADLQAVYDGALAARGMKALWAFGSEASAEEERRAGRLFCLFLSFGS
ncbi:hypothetical protein N0V93_010304 [Gnomoniopsis smithogilvyi]|uniref:Uncharacterized protein n=1 Tax=Gnomoniopsis smithogilvyi TaxID=1191159 RepID=A0A9W8YII0_9PEZI|nr:hypothetical protein N0V93_010304 [Gnomoniopsis smithogilvyi]